jgi:hypothetical protein
VIIQRILAARTAALLRYEPIPNTLRVPVHEMPALKYWIFRNIECDPFLGYRFFDRKLFGMLIFEDRWVSDIVATHEEQLSFFDFGF